MQPAVDLVRDSAGDSMQPLCAVRSTTRLQKCTYLRETDLIRSVQHLTKTIANQNSMGSTKA